MEYLVTVFIPVWNQEELVLRALRSIPEREDIEILVVDDGSTDDTLKNVLEYAKTHPNMSVLTNGENRGLGYTKNVAYDHARGKYVHQLDSDDYLYMAEYERVLAQLDGSDIVYCDARKNDGSVFHLTMMSQRMLCVGWFRFIRREFLGAHRCPEVKTGEDWYLNEELQAIPHTEKYTGIVAYHYNFPREGSLFDLLVKGEL